jgi:hypothetical protein
MEIGPPGRIAENRHTPRSIDICAMINQDSDNLHIAARTGSMEWKHAIEDRVYGLAVVERIFDEPDIAGGGGGVEAQAGNWESVSTESGFTGNRTPTFGGDIVLGLCLVECAPHSDVHGRQPRAVGKGLCGRNGRRPL